MLLTASPSYAEASGAVPYNMTNNYMFHAVLQRDEVALKGLIAALLHIPADTIVSIGIQNPILIGASIIDRDTILDVLVCFNDNTYLNLEMQVANEGNWRDRSLYYLCRVFDNLHHGDDFDQVKSAIHIGFLDFPLFPEHPEFYATYRLRNVKNGQEYSDKFTLSVVQLQQIELATPEDIRYGIDKWVRLFRATTWEDIKMIAQNDVYLESAAQSMYSNNLDPMILRLCRKSQEEIDGDRHRRQRLAEQDRIIAEKDRTLADQDRRISEQNQKLSEQDQKLSEQDQKLSEQDQKLSELAEQLAALRQQLLDAGIQPAE